MLGNLDGLAFSKPHDLLKVNEIYDVCELCGLIERSCSLLLPLLLVSFLLDYLIMFAE